MELTLILIGLMLLVSAFFSASETALTATSRALMHQLEQEGDKRAAVVNKLLRRRETLISTILIGNNIVNIGASAMAAGVMISLFGESGVAIATGVMTVLLVIFAEILPKTYALVDSARLARIVAPYMRILVILLTPVNAIAQWLVRSMLVLFRANAAMVGTASHVLAELRGVIDLQMGEKQIKEEVKHERSMLRSVLDLADVTVSEIMIHRKKVVTIDADLPMTDIIEQVAGSPYSRVPLWRDQPDNIVGVIHAKALLRAIEAADGRAEKVNVMSLASKPWFIPDTTTLLDQLHAFRARHEHFALVVDEYGSLLGVVTLEDILEEIVGDIRDEHDVAVAGVRPQTDGTYLIDGSVTLRDLNREFDWDLPDEKASTLAGFLLHEARTIPDVGQNFLFHGFRFQVARRNRNQLVHIRVTPPQPAKDKTPAPTAAA